MEQEVRVSRFYDDLGVREWLRLDADPRARVVFHLHRFLLTRFVRAGDKILDAGSGPGRFSIELARLGAQVIASDISSVQLVLNRENTAFAVDSVSRPELVRLTITDLPFADGAFDCVALPWLGAWSLRGRGFEGSKRAR
jgi:ubiquinone/menaquinone biosynthesis C-methylase UbiE